MPQNDNIKKENRFTDNYNFTRIQVKENINPILDQMKMLSTIVKDRLSWDRNCNHLIKK